MISLKAKILHAEGRTDEALELLDCLPVWPSHVMTEQLFATDTPEYRYWNKRNCYGFLDVAAIKLARITCLDPELAIEEKLARLERLAQGFDALSDAENAACFCVCTQSVLESAARILDAGNTAIENVIRIREKQIKAMEKMMRRAETDEVLKESLTRTYKSYTPIEHLINRLSTSSQPSLAKLRENAEYMKMIEKYK